MPRTKKESTLSRGRHTQGDQKNQNSLKRKVACYLGTQNYYPVMVTALKSLLLHTKVDRVFFLIEDDEFPFPLPKTVECINVSNLGYVRRDSPNYISYWTYMTIYKACLYRVLPDDVEEVLCLDDDTLVVQDISEIWETDLGDNYIAGAKEPNNSKDGLYINLGVTLQNLKLLRQGKGNEIMYALNTQKFRLVEQDAINTICRGKILEISPNYNACRFTNYADNPKIMHFPMDRSWREYDLYKEYEAKEMPNV